MLIILARTLENMRITFRGGKGHDLATPWLTRENEGGRGSLGRSRDLDGEGTHSACHEACVRAVLLP